MTEEGASSESERTVAFLLSLRARGVRDLALLRAMERVPREHFAPSRFADLPRQCSLAALTRPMDQDDRRVRQGLGETGLGKTGIEGRGGHGG